jgi:hypothetical protein
MGQYYKIVNLDKRQYLDPSRFGTGPKLRTIAYSSCGILSALTILLAKSDGTGGGDIPSEGTGLWAGDRVVIIGDYDSTSLHRDLDEYDDVSLDILRVMIRDDWVRQLLLEHSETDSYGLRSSLQAIGIDVPPRRTPSGTEYQVDDPALNGFQKARAE